MTEPLVSQAEIRALLDQNTACSDELARWMQIMTASLPALEEHIAAKLQWQAAAALGDAKRITSLAPLYAQGLWVLPCDIDGLAFEVLIAAEQADVLTRMTQGATTMETVLPALAGSWLEALCQQIPPRQRSPIQTHMHQPTFLRAQQLERLSIGARDTFVLLSLQFQQAALDLGLLIDSDQLPPFLADRAAQYGMTAVRSESGTAGSIRKQVPVETIRFEDLQEEQSAAEEHGWDLVDDVLLTVVVELGTIEQTLGQLMALQVDSVLQLNRGAGEAVDIYLKGHEIAQGEVMVLDEKFAVRVLEVVPPAQRLQPAAST